MVGVGEGGASSSADDSSSEADFSEMDASLGPLVLGGLSLVRNQDLRLETGAGRSVRVVKRIGWEGNLQLLLRSSEPCRLRLASDLLPLELEAVDSVALRRKNPGLAGMVEESGDAFTVNPDFFSSGNATLKENSGATSKKETTMDDPKAS